MPRETAGGLDGAAWRALGSPPPAEEDAHVCASCGRGCALCRDGKPCARTEWCAWCESAYADNRPAEDGRVYCAECDAPFPTLAGLISAGLSRYPRFCRPCRERHRAESAADREHYGEAPPPAADRHSDAPPPRRPSVSGHPTKKSEEDSARDPEGSGARPSVMSQVQAAQQKHTAATDPDTLYLRGGFIPRGAPGARPSEACEMTAGALPPDAAVSAVRDIAFGSRD